MVCSRPALRDVVLLLKGGGSNEVLSCGCTLTGCVLLLKRRRGRAHCLCPSHPKPTSSRACASRPHRPHGSCTHGSSRTSSSTSSRGSSGSSSSSSAFSAPYRGADVGGLRGAEPRYGQRVHRQQPQQPQPQPQCRCRPERGLRGAPRRDAAGRRRPLLVLEGAERPLPLPSPVSCLPRLHCPISRGLG